MQLSLTCGTEGRLRHPNQWCPHQNPAHWGSPSGTGRSSHSQSHARTQCPVRSLTGPAPVGPIQYYAIQCYKSTITCMINRKFSTILILSAVLCEENTIQKPISYDHLRMTPPLWITSKHQQQQPRRQSYVTSKEVAVMYGLSCGVYMTINEDCCCTKCLVLYCF